jgi:hypothetical protein
MPRGHRFQSSIGLVEEKGKLSLNRNLLRNRKSGVSSIVGGLMLFAMIFTVGFGFIYLIGQDNLFYQQAAKSNNALVSQQSEEHLQVDGYAAGNNLGFYVNNTGIALSIISYWVFSQTNNALLQYDNMSTAQEYMSPSSSWVVSNTGITISNSSSKFIIKVLTARGTSAIGTYPSNQLTNAAVNSLVAGGFGSLQMQFSSFTWYDYISGPSKQVELTQNGGYCYGDQQCSSCAQQGYNECYFYFTNMCTKGQNCNGGSWTVDLAHPFEGSRMPEGYESSCVTGNHSNTETCYFDEVPVLFSVNITNDDPGLADIVLNSETNLWVVETCDSGIAEGNCVSVGNPVFVFYMMNVNPTTGVISSINQGSFSEIQIPYGTTKTLYYGSLYDLSLSSYNYVALTSATNSNPYYYGQFAVFLLFAGTKISTSGFAVYGQNIPFESTTVGDNLGWYSQTPLSTGSGVKTTFTLQVNNSAFSYSQAKINKIVLNASAFSSVSVTSTPSGWTSSTTNGIITWTSSSGIAYNSYANFQWTGTAPTVSGSAQEIFPVYIYWSSGVVTELQAAAVCTV